MRKVFGTLTWWRLSIKASLDREETEFIVAYLGESAKPWDLEL